METSDTEAWYPQGDFGLSLTQDGYLPAAFLVRFIRLSMHLFLSTPCSQLCFTQQAAGALASCSSQ